MKNQKNATKAMKVQIPEKIVVFVFPRVRLSSRGAQGLSGKQDWGNRGYRPSDPRTLHSQLRPFFRVFFSLALFQLQNNENLMVISPYFSPFPPVQNSHPASHPSRPGPFSWAPTPMSFPMKLTNSLENSTLSVECSLLREHQTLEHQTA